MQGVKIGVKIYAVLSHFLHIVRGHQNLFVLTSYFSSSFLRQIAERPTPEYRRQLTTSQVFCQVERRIRSRESNHQPLP